jgi:hypothetical protein
VPALKCGWFRIASSVNFSSMKRILLLLMVVVCAPPSFAQILNIDRADTSAYTKKTRCNFALNSGLEIDKQKTTLYDATNTLETMLQHSKELFIFAASHRFTYNGADDILNAGYVHLRYRHGYKNKLQPEPFLQYQFDNKRGLVHRFLSGANLRYNFWRADIFDFNAGFGFMYEDERWNYAAVDSSKIPPSPVSIRTQVAKINCYLRLDWKPSANSTVAFNVFLQTKPNEFSPRIAPHVQWNIEAGKHVGFSIAFSGLYDTEPVVPIDKFYYSFSNTLFVKF